MENCLNQTLLERLFRYHLNIRRYQTRFVVIDITKRDTMSMLVVHLGHSTEFVFIIIPPESFWWAESETDFLLFWQFLDPPPDGKKFQKIDDHGGGV